MGRSELSGFWLMILTLQWGCFLIVSALPLRSWMAFPRLPSFMHCWSSLPPSLQTVELWNPLRYHCCVKTCLLSSENHLQNVMLPTPKRHYAATFQPAIHGTWQECFYTTLYSRYEIWYEACREPILSSFFLSGELEWFFYGQTKHAVSVYYLISQIGGEYVFLILRQPASSGYRAWWCYSAYHKYY